MSQQIQAAQMAQLAPQGIFGNLLNQRNPFAAQFGTGMCSPYMGSGQTLPFGADPLAQAGMGQQANSAYPGMQYGSETTLH